MQVEVQVAHREFMPWQSMLLMSVGDIQYDGPNGAADIPRLKRYLK